MPIGLNAKLFDSDLLNANPKIVKTEDGELDEVYDLHTSATIITYIAANEPENFKCNQGLRDLIKLEDPNVNVDSLLTLARQEDRASILRLIALVRGGLESLSGKATQ